MFLESPRHLLKLSNNYVFLNSVERTVFRSVILCGLTLLTTWVVPSIFPKYELILSVAKLFQEKLPRVLEIWFLKGVRNLLAAGS